MKLTEILEDRKLKLLGHVLRRDRQHPLHQAAFSTRSALPRETEHRRRGRPRQFWTTNNMNKAWEVIKTHDATQPQIPFDKNNRSIRERIIEQAQRYQPPFNKGNPIWAFNVKVVLSVTPLLSVKLLLSVKFILHWFRFNSTPPSSERGPRFLIVGRKRVSAYDLWQCPCYRLWQEKTHN